MVMWKKIQEDLKERLLQRNKAICDQQIIFKGRKPAQFKFFAPVKRWYDSYGNSRTAYSNDNEPQKGQAFKMAAAFEYKLSKRGFKRLGSGCFSTVYHHPSSDKVIKVTRNQDNWIEYIKWASENGYAGKFAPKVFSFKNFNDNFSVAVMEKLDKCMTQVDRSSKHYVTYSLLGLTEGNETASSVVDLLEPGIAKFLNHFHKKWDGWDMHRENVMVKGDRIVIVDPLAGRLTKEFPKRLRSKDLLAAA